MKNGKPIFEEERLFLNERLGVDLPTDCWRDGSKIYLDCTCEKPLYTFRISKDKKQFKKSKLDNNAKSDIVDAEDLMVDSRYLILIKDNSSLFIDYKQKKISDLQVLYNEELKKLEKDSVDFLVDFMLNQDYVQLINAHSSGKDSCLSFHLFQKSLSQIKQIDYAKYEEIDKKWIVNFANTTNDTAYTYKFIKSQPRLNIMNPKKGLYNWIRQDKKYIHPTILVRNCCSTYKEGQLSKAFNNDDKLIMITGVRKYESSKRSKYEKVMDHDVRVKIHGKDNLPEKWINIAPCCEWKDYHVWLYILKNNINFNQMYRLGFNRIGCLNCPFQTDYIDLITEWYFPQAKKRWDDIIRVTYDKHEVWNRLKWTEYEYVDLGKWKAGTGFEYEITNLKMTEERVSELAKRKGCDEYIAKKFWDKTCTSCSKKMNPTEISMSMKLLGRDSNKMCKKCLCDHLDLDKKTYKEKQIEFTNSECTLF